MTVVALMGATALFAQTDVVATFQQATANAKAGNFAEAIAQFESVVEAGWDIEDPDANQLNYSYFSETFNAPVEVEGNKLTVKMSSKVPTLKDVTVYAFQSTDCSQMHLCMDETAFVNFYTNMQAILMDAVDEQFDITDADSVNAIYNNIDNAVETIKLTIVMSKAK